MEDQKIIDLYFARSETAISETDAKYGKYCYSIAYNILTNNEDAEESVSDTYMAAWKAMPPRRPAILATFLGMETDGKSAGIGLYDAVSGGLTLNLGVLTADETSLSLKINYRYPVTKSYSDCGPGFNAAFGLAGFTLDSEMHKEKLYIPEDSELVSTLLRVYREQTGLDGAPKCIGGGTYAKALPNTLAFGPIFPGDEVREHKGDEYITVERMVKNAQIIAQAMYAMAK